MAGKRYSMQVETERAGVAILISDEMDFKPKWEQEINTVII